MTLFYIIALVVLSACGSKGHRGQLIDEDLIYKQNYEKNFEVWQNQSEGAAYEYSYEKKCFCLSETVLYTVSINKKGGLEKVTATQSDGTVEEYSTKEQLESIVLIDDLFVYIEDKIAGKLATANVTYNDELGYPESLYVDLDLRMIDEEVSYIINNLKIKTAP